MMRGVGSGVVWFLFVAGAFAQYNRMPPGTNSLPTMRTNPTSTATAAPSRGKLSAKDKTFMMNAGKGGQMEVEWGKLAAQNGQNTDVKKFGNRMLTDHSKANSELMALAMEEGVTLPGAKSPGKWKSNNDYMDMMVKDHQSDLAAFHNQAHSKT